MEPSSSANSIGLRNHVRMRPIIAIHCLAFLLSSVTLWGQLRSVSFQDEAADHVGEIDLRTITLTFDPLSGEYQILLESSPSAPFEGSYLIGINFFNADLETRTIDPSYFHVDAEIKQQDCWSRTFELRGIEPRLKAWSPGNRIVAGGPQPLGLPDGFFILQTGLASFINPTQANELIGDGQISIVENADQFLDAHNPPNAEDDHFEFPEDTIKQQLNVLENDCSPAELHSLLQITAIAEGPSNGSAELLSGELFYTPNSEFFGTDMLQYIVSDSKGATSVGSVHLTITSVNDPPLANDDSFVIDGRLPRHVLDVLANDSSAPDQNETLAIIRWVADADLGKISVQDGLLVLEPPNPIRGEAQFTYTIGDGNGRFDVAIVKLNGSFVNSDPLAIDDFASGIEDTALIIDALANDSSGPDQGEILSITSVAPSHHGVIPRIIDNQIHYQAPTDFYGVDVFQYVISDGFQGTSQATIQVTIENTNDPPTVVPDHFEMIGDGTPYFFQPLANDLSAPDPLESIVLTKIESDLTQTLLTLEGNRIRAVASPGTVGVFQFTYWAEDSGGLTSQGTVTLTIRQANFPPIAVADAIRIDSDGVNTPISVLDNDSTAPDNDETLTITSVNGSGSPGSNVTHDGTQIFFTPSEGFESGWVRYAISDSNGGEDSALVIITATPVIESPAANNDFAIVLEDQSMTVDVLKNDLIASEYRANTSLRLINGPLHGTATVTPLQAIEYRPSPDYTGRDSIHYSLTYPSGTSSAAELVISVKDTNDPPVAIDDAFEMLEDGGTLSLDLLQNDSSGPDQDDTLVVTAPTTTPNGTLQLQPDQSLLYQPNEHFHGVDRFLYSIQDSGGEFATANVQIKVLSVNDPPLARPDQATVASDISEAKIDVVANDSALPDVDEQLTVFAVTQGRFGGQVRIEENHAVYSPPARSIHEDHFSYSISDGNGGASVASVSVTIQRVDRPPVGVPDTYELPEDSLGFQLDLLNNDASGSATQPDLQLGTIDGLTHPGTLQRGPEGLNFTPEPDFYGTVTFLYTILECRFESEPIPVTIQVLSVNDPPQARHDFLTLTDPEAAISIDVLANDTIEPDLSETLTLTDARLESNSGSVSIVDNQILYNPPRDDTGTQSIRYEISDGNGGVAEALLEITIQRTDRTAPEIRCQDIARVLPLEGRLIIDPSELDAGTLDDSGAFTLHLEPAEFGIENLGRNEVFLRAIDAAGNVSQCSASITISSPPQTLELRHPQPYSVHPVSPDFGFSAADIPVEIGITGDIQTIQIEGDGRPLATLDVPSGADSVQWLWEEVLWGDHEIVVTGEDLATGRRNRVASLFSVSELASHAALILPSDTLPVSTLPFRDYLFEMGVDLEVFHEPLPIDFAQRPWDLVICYRQENDSIENQTIQSLSLLHQEGVSTYMMGRGISTVSPSDPQLRSAWDQLNLIDSSDQTPLSGQVDLHLEEEPFFDGRFGDVHPFALQRALGGELRSLQSHPLVTIEGATLAARRETLASIEPRQTRTITQLFSLAEPDGESEIKVLFQNSVCWLLQHCISCDNANLPPALIDPISDVLEDQSFSVLLKLENNGECEISGAQIFLDASGVEAQALTLDGRPAPIQFDAVGRRWMSRVGRVGKGSVSARQVEWTLRITDPLVDHLEFTSSANNSDPITIDLPVHVTTFRLRDTLDRGLILQVQGRPGQLFRIERTQDLSSPTRWQRLANRLSTDARGIAELPVQATSAAAFYRVSLIEF